MNSNPLRIGEAMPSFNLPATDGLNYADESFNTKKLVCIIFSCNHCPYVRAYEERIIELQDEFKDELQIVAINSNDSTKYPEDSFENMKLRYSERGFNFIYLRDESQEVAKKFGASHTPQIFLFDDERKLIYTGKIDDNWQFPEKVQSRYLRDAIIEYLEGKEISVPETYSIGCTIKWK